MTRARPMIDQLRGGTAACLGASAALVFACTWMGPVGAPVWLRHAGVPCVLLAACVLFVPRLRGAAAALTDVAPAFLALILFLALVGIGGMVNHGAIFEAMSHDFWHADLQLAPDRRPVLPAIAAMLPPWPAPYGVVWYACFAALFLTAWRHLQTTGLAPLQRFSVLTASIVAYLLIVPGYTEVLSYLVALLCWRAELTVAEKAVAAAVMIGGHEVAGAFCLAFLAIEATGPDRREWTGIGLFLFAVYTVGYLLSAGALLTHDLALAVQPAAVNKVSAWRLDFLHPWRCLLALFAAYKLLWLLVPSGLAGGGRTRLHALCVLCALPLVLVAVDTSRVVQFGSLSMFALGAAFAPRTPLTIANLALPSLYVSVMTIPAWGKGLYAAYLLAAHVFGVSLGGMAFG